MPLDYATFCSTLFGLQNYVLHPDNLKKIFKSAAKVLLFFDIHKYFCEKMRFYSFYLRTSFFFRTFAAVFVLTDMKPLICNKLKYKYGKGKIHCILGL